MHIILHLDKLSFSNHTWHHSCMLSHACQDLPVVGGNLLPYSTKLWRWRLGANSPKFYVPKFSITIVFYRCSTQSANVFSAKYTLGANPP